MRELVEMLYAVDDVKRLAPYKWQLCDVISLEMKIRDRAKTVRQHILYHAFRQIQNAR